jgi:general secretion pathway protein K
VKKPAQGFALAAALWLLAGLAIVVSLVNDAAVTSAERVRQLRERADFVRSALASRANMQYFVALSQPQAAGFARDNATLLADETPYKLDALSVIRLQDLGGLVNLNRFNRQTLERLLSACGVASEQIPYLIDALEDYTDTDDLQRINGAERDTYILAGKPPPRNDALLSVDEMWQVQGWSAFKKAWAANGCTRAFTAPPITSQVGPSTNVATAPMMVLRATGVDDATAGDVINARGDPQNLAGRAALANALSGNNTGMFGQGSGTVQPEFRVTHEHASQPWVMEYTFKLDLNNENRPWTITQPVIGVRSHTPVIPAARAVEWPLNSALPSPTRDANPVVPF